MLTVTPKEPQSARFTSDRAIVKDHYYYKGKDFSWNKPACINEKYYPFYHKQKDENKLRIELMKQKEIEDKKIKEGTRKEKIIFKKVQEQQNFESRIKEREALQRVSSQTISTQNFEEDSKIASEIVAKKFNSGKVLRSDEFSWNILSQSSKKNVHVYLGSYSIRGEESMIRKLKEKDEEEKLEEEEKKKKELLFHKKLRDIFKSRQEENIAKDKKVSRPQTGKYSLFEKDSARGQSVGSPDLQSRDFLLPASASPDMKTKKVLRIQALQNKEKGSQSVVTQVVERLTVSRENSKREFNIENNECQGMLVQNMNEKIFYPGNSFYDALKNQSKVFTEILEENKNSHRPSTGRKTMGSGISSAVSRRVMSSRPETARIKGASLFSPLSIGKQNDNNISLIKESTLENQAPKEPTRVYRNEDDNSPHKAVIRAMTEFDAQLKGSPKKVGYARLALEEAYRLTRGQGLKEAIKIEKIKAEQLVKCLRV